MGNSQSLQIAIDFKGKIHVDQRSSSCVLIAMISGPQFPILSSRFFSQRSDMMV